MPRPSRPGPAPSPTPRGGRAQLVVARHVAVAVRRRAAMARAPRDERMQGGPQLGARVGELVELALALHEDPARHEPAQPVGQHRARDVEARDPVAVAPHPEERIADDEQRPALAEHLERRGERALLALVVLAEHGASLVAYGSFIESARYYDLGSRYAYRRRCHGKGHRMSGRH